MRICTGFSFKKCTISAAGLLALALTGCAVDPSMQVANQPLATLQGIIHGGPSPIVGATVNYYATTSGGSFAGNVYTPGAPTLLATATTLGDGSFTFVGAAACPAGQQGYVVAYGGDPGSGPNPNYVAMAALGPCATISTATRIFISEATTVAAAFALRPFTFVTVDGGGNPLVEVGAPANNNAAAGVCTTVANVTTGCVAAGLTHAFANALNLTNSVTTAGGEPDGYRLQRCSVKPEQLGAAGVDP